jgi:ATP-dependent Clp protease ATP-binding subunit ClpA
LERANLEAAALADAEVASEHVLLALTSRWAGSVATGWLQQGGIDPQAIRQRVVDLTEGVTPPEPAPMRDDRGRLVRDAAGRPIIKAVEVPPGSRAEPG